MAVHLFKKRIRFMEEKLLLNCSHQDELRRNREKSFSKFEDISEQVKKHVRIFEVQFEDNKTVEWLKVNLGQIQAEIALIKATVQQQDEKNRELERIARDSLQLANKVESTPQNSSNRNIQNSNVIDTIDLDTDIAEDTDLHSVGLQQQLSDITINSEGPTIGANLLDISRLGPSREPTTWASTSNASTCLDPGSITIPPQSANRSSPPLPNHSILGTSKKRKHELIEDSNPARGPRSPPPSARRSRSPSISEEIIRRISEKPGEPVENSNPTMGAGSNTPVDGRAARCSRPGRSNPDQAAPPNWYSDQAEFPNKAGPNIATHRSRTMYRSGSRSHRRSSRYEDAGSRKLISVASSLPGAESQDQRLANLRQEMAPLFVCRFMFGRGFSVEGGPHLLHCDMDLKYSLVPHLSVNLDDHRNPIKPLQEPKVIRIGWGNCRQVTCYAIKSIELNGRGPRPANFRFDVYLVDLRENKAFDKNRIILGSDFLKRYLIKKRGNDENWGTLVFKDKSERVYLSRFKKKTRQDKPIREARLY